MITQIEAQRARMLSMNHPFIADVKSKSTVSNDLDELLTVKTKVSDEMVLKSHTFAEVKNN